MFGQLNGCIDATLFLSSYILPGNRISCSPSAYLLRKNCIIEALNLSLTSAPDLRGTGVGYDIATIFYSLVTKKVYCFQEQLVIYRDNSFSLTRLAGGGRHPHYLSIRYHRALLEIIRKKPSFPPCLAVLFRALTNITISYYQIALYVFSR
jgi:hypothetical protein